MINFFITSSLLIVFIIILRLFLGNHISQRLKYALWLVVAIKLLVPIPSPSSRMSIMNYVDKTPVYVERIKPVESQISNNSLPNHSSISFDLILKSGSYVIAGVLVYSNLIFYIRLVKNRKFIEKDQVKIYQSNIISTPCLYGIIPSIYVTDETYNKYIVTHEKMHFKHLDFIWVIIRAVCIIMYWYNPFVWIAGYLSQKDSELACDEAVISYLGESERKLYGKALLDVVVKKSNHMIFSTQVSRGQKEMKKRIKFIVKKPKKYIFNSLICIICLFMICACTLTSKNQNILNINSNDDYLELVKNVMPDFISKELKCVNRENDIISVSDVLKDPSLKFDIYLSGDGISQFRCDVDYYILLQSIDNGVDEAEAKNIIKKFAEKFINYDIEVTLNEDLNSDEEYVFTDQYGSLYMVNKLYGYLCEYEYQNQTIELTDNQKSELLNDLKAVMPDVIIEEINKHGYFYTYDDQNAISIANAKEDPTLRLDFVFDEKGELIQYVSKEYGFVEDLGYHDILYNDDYYEKIVEKFSQVFLKRDVTLTEISLPSHYDGYDGYRAYKDQFGGKYVINMAVQMVVNYEV